MLFREVHKKYIPYEILLNFRQSNTITFNNLVRVPISIRAIAREKLSVDFNEFNSVTNSDTTFLFFKDF